MDSRDSSSASRDDDEDGLISITAELAKEAAVLFQSRRYSECIDVLQKKKDDPKVESGALHYLICVEEDTQMRRKGTSLKRLARSHCNVQDKNVRPGDDVGCSSQYTESSQGEMETMASMASFCGYEENVEELKNLLAQTFFALERAKKQAKDDMRRNEENVNQLLYFLKVACQERDEAWEQLHNISFFLEAYCTGLLLARRVLNSLEMDEEYEGNVEIEGIVKQLATAGDHDRITAVINLLTTEFTYSPQANHHKGGLIGLAAATVGLTMEASQHLEVREYLPSRQ